MRSDIKVQEDEQEENKQRIKSRRERPKREHNAENVSFVSKRSH
jgi:hypothetical protein